MDIVEKSKDKVTKCIDHGIFGNVVACRLCIIILRVRFLSRDSDVFLRLSLIDMHKHSKL